MRFNDSSMAAMMLVLFVTAAMVAVAVTEKACCFPKQFEGVLGMVTHTMGHRPKRVTTMARYSIDYTNQKLATNELILSHGHKPLNVSVFVDFKAEKHYAVLWEKKWCCARNMSAPMAPRCGLDNATYMGTETFGAGSSALRVTNWGIRFRMHRLRVATEITVTKKNCVPFSQFVMGRAGFTHFVQMASFFNNSLGIKSPSVFTPPDFCKKDAGDCALTLELPEATQHIVDSVTEVMEDSEMNSDQLMNGDTMNSNQVKPEQGLKEDLISDWKM